MEILDHIISHCWPLFIFAAVAVVMIYVYYRKACGAIERHNAIERHDQAGYKSGDER